ncbi:MAG: hypothetical protein AB1467_05355 [Candidatus Diapherotrites archaeon]
MKFKYCPSCGSMQLKYNGQSLVCTKCNYAGQMKEDAMDKINAFVTSVKRGNSSQVMVERTPREFGQQIIPVKEKLKKFSGSEDFEIL